MFMLFLCIYVCKYIYLCVSVYTCFIVQNMYHCSLPVRLSIRVVEFEFYLYSFYWPSSNYQLIFLEKGQIWDGMWNKVTSLFVSCIPVCRHSRPKRQESPTDVPEAKRSPLNVTPCSCLLCVYTYLVVLQYRNLLLLCGGISKPVVHCRSLIYSLLHCSLYVRSVCEPSPQSFDLLCAWCNNDWKWVECCVQRRSPQGLKSHYYKTKQD